MDDDPNAKAVIDAAEEVLRNASGSIDQEIVNNVFSIVARVGAMLLAFRSTMKEGGFSDEWIEARCTEIFQKFMRPTTDG